MHVNRIVKHNGEIERSSAKISASVYNVRIKQEVYERLATLANQEDRSVTNYINRILEEKITRDI